MVHKNRHLRHFAAQCFSYILRKIEINDKVMEMIIKPIFRVKHEESGEELGPF